MASSSNLDNLRSITRDISIYGGLFVLIIGLFSELLTIIIFTTLKTFRQTTCCFYLIINSIGNIGILSTIVLRIIYDGFNTGLSYTPLLCKFRYFLAQYWLLVIMTSMCLATIDQFLSMTSYRRWNSLRIAHRLIAATCSFWFIYSILTFIYYDSYLNTCIVTNAVFVKYFTYFQTPILSEFLPLSIMITFSLLAFFKARSIASRQVHIVRLSRDRQLTVMTLVRVLFIVITSLPYVIFFVYTLILNSNDPMVIVKNQFIFAITGVLCYMSYSVRVFL